MEDSKTVLENETKLSVHPSKESANEKEQSEVIKEDLRTSSDVETEQQSVANINLTVNETHEVNEEGTLAKMCQEHSMALFYSTVMLCAANLITISLCFCGSSSMSDSLDIGLNLESLEMQWQGLALKIKAIEIDTCQVMTVALPLTFLLMPFIFGQALVKCGTKEYGNEKESSAKDILISFVCKHPMLVFWTGYAMTFLNTAILAICYCGVPKMFMDMSFCSLPSLEAAIPSLSMVELTGYGVLDFTINACITTTILAVLILVCVVPFMLLCPYSPLYTKLKSQRVALNRIVKSNERNDVKQEEMSKIVQYVAANPNLSFWTGYSLTCLNIFVLIACFCTPKCENDA